MSVKLYKGCGKMYINKNKIASQQMKTKDGFTIISADDRMEYPECVEEIVYLNVNVTETIFTIERPNDPQELLTFTSSVSNELATAMVRSGDHDVRDAALIAGVACEACLNVLGHDYGLSWGYERYSDEWKLARTSCRFCEEMCNDPEEPIECTKCKDDSTK